MFVYAGSYTDPPAGSGDGISVFQFDSDSGTLTLVQTVSDVVNPSFLAIDSGRRWLYAVNELDEGRVSAFARDPRTGRLTFLNSQSSHGAHPCHVSLDSTDRHVLVANYSSGTVAAFPVSDDGRLELASDAVQHVGSGVNPGRQAEPHAHMIAPTPDGRFVIVSDLGLDQLIVYRLEDSTGKFHAHGSIPAEPGAGPRHFAFAPNGRGLYAINELNSTLTHYDYMPGAGTAHFRQTLSSLPDQFKGENSCAHVAVSPDGRFVYGSNRGHDSIAIWAIDQTSGELSTVGHELTGGKEPRNFSLDPSGAWLLAANQRSDAIVTFRRDLKSGALTTTGQVTRIGSPVAILFVA